MVFNGECLFILFSEKLPSLSRCIGFHDASRFVNSNHCLFLLVKFQGYSNRFSWKDHSIALYTVGSGRRFRAQHRHPS